MLMEVIVVHKQLWTGTLFQIMTASELLSPSGVFPACLVFACLQLNWGKPCCL